jgi:glycosyltransferase involved in cell wall biosynthesis
MHGPASGKHWLERWARRTVPDMVLSNSHFTAETLPQLYPGLRAEVVYCPVAPPEFRQSPADRSETRAELQTPQDAVVIIQVSRLERLKGQRLHLDALARIKDLPDWICWLVGGAQRDGETQYFEELKLHASRLGIADRIRFLNQRADVSRLLAAADIYCQPNTQPDSFGISFIEALYAGLPVVTTNIGGAREIVNGSCGLLVQPGDTAALGESLRRLIDDKALRTRLGNAGLARARSLCDPEARMTQFHKALQDQTEIQTLTLQSLQVPD